MVASAAAGYRASFAPNSTAIAAAISICDAQGVSSSTVSTYRDVSDDASPPGRMGARTVDDMDCK